MLSIQGEIPNAPSKQIISKSANFLKSPELYKSEEKGMYMSRSVTKLVLVLAILYCGTAESSPTVAQASGNEAGFIISNQTAALACVGGNNEITGSNNDLTITGKCSDLYLRGSNNRITATLDCVGGKAAILGSNDELTITGKCSDLDLRGSNNKIATFDCAGGKAAIMGSGNELAITGECSNLDLRGSANRITATLDCAGGKAAIIGSGNELTIGGKCSDFDLRGSANQIATLDCDGGKVAIRGSANELTITGKCSNLNLDFVSSGNKITIDFGPAASVDISGSGNAILWTSADGKPPTINDTGRGNRLTPRAQ